MKTLPYDLAFAVSLNDERRWSVFAVVVAILSVVILVGLAWKNAATYTAEQEKAAELLVALDDQQTASPQETMATSRSSIDIDIARTAMAFDWQSELHTINTAASTPGVRLAAVHIAPKEHLEVMTVLIDAAEANQELLARINGGDRRWLIKEQFKGHNQSRYVVHLETVSSPIE